MFGHFGTAIRFFAIGLAVGLLTAPRRGEETRAMLRERLFQILGTNEQQAAEMTTRIQGGLQQAQRAAQTMGRQAAEAASDMRQSIEQATGEVVRSEAARHQPSEHRTATGEA